MIDIKNPNVDTIADDDFKRAHFFSKDRVLLVERIFPSGVQLPSVNGTVSEDFPVWSLGTGTVSDTVSEDSSDTEVRLEIKLDKNFVLVSGVNNAKGIIRKFLEEAK